MAASRATCILPDSPLRAYDAAERSVHAAVVARMSRVVTVWGPIGFWRWCRAVERRVARRRFRTGADRYLNPRNV
jgi:hypothetical protein